MKIFLVKISILSSFYKRKSTSIPIIVTLSSSRDGPLDHWRQMNYVNEIITQSTLKNKRIDTVPDRPIKRLSKGKGERSCPSEGKYDNPPWYSDFTPSFTSVFRPYSVDRNVDWRKRPWTKREGVTTHPLVLIVSEPLTNNFYRFEGTQTEGLIYTPCLGEGKVMVYLT